MPHTIAEKILSDHAGEEVKAGQRIWADVDMAVARDFGGPNCVLEYEQHFGEGSVADPDKIAFTFDYQAPAKDTKVANNQQICREFARKQNIPHLYDVNTGIGQHILLENGLVSPGSLIIGTDSHMNLLGAVGSMSLGMGTTDIVATWKGGRLWFRVPQTIRVNLVGELTPPSCAKDLILALLRDTDSEALNYRALEFTGGGTEGMDLAGRLTICSMITESGGKVGFFSPGKAVLDWLSPRMDETPQPISADEGAEYVEEFDFDLAEIVPLIACPHTPDNVKTVQEVIGEKIDSAFIGSCTNGRIEDLRIAAKIIERAGRKLAKGMRLTVVPATMEVAKAALSEGLWEIFLEAGAMVTNPGCSLCTIGHHGVLYAGERLISTSNRNFLHKLGRDAYVYLASPATVSASAVAGAIADPSDYIQP